MHTLNKLSRREKGDINIIELSATKYKEIGTILLKDKYGAVIENIEMSVMRGPKEAIRQIYTQWIRQDEHCSWLTLTRCLRDCELNTLAFDIEQHFDLPLPQPPTDGIIIPYFKPTII